jgi:hypothetical protein
MTSNSGPVYIRSTDVGKPTRRVRNQSIAPSLRRASRRSDTFNVRGDVPP